MGEAVGGRVVRSALVKLRVTEAEKSAVEAAAKAAGMSVSDYVRGSLRAVNAASVQAAVIERAQAESNEVRERRVVSAEKAVKVLDVGPSFRCPLAPSRCSFVAGSRAARCPVHGRTVVAS